MHVQSPKRRALPRGIQLLRDYIDKKNTTLTRFCEEHELDRFAVLRVMNADGERDLRVSVNLAAAIARATKNKVPISAWESPAEPDPVEAIDTTGHGARGAA